MTKNTRALLLSAFVIPGVGQFYLKRYKSAGLLIGLTLFAVVYLCVEVMLIASTLIDKITTGEISPEYSALRTAIYEALEHSDSLLITYAIYGLVAIWLISLIDILRLRNTK